MGLFYKTRYRCKKCGQTYSELPIYCNNCGEELSFICPLDIHFPELAKYRPTKYCEEISKSIFSFGKKKRERELQAKIEALETELSEKKNEIKELYHIWNETKGRYRTCATEYETNKSIDGNMIEAVKYAMKHAHPDNGGNSEDFMKFKKCYEELTRK